MCRLQAFSGLEVGFYPVLSEMPSRHMLNCRSQSRGRPGPCRLANPESCEESIVIEGISWHYGLRFRMSSRYQASCRRQRQGSPTHWKISPHLDLIGFFPQYSVLHYVILQVISLCAFVVATIAAKRFLSMMPHGADVLNLSISKSWEGSTSIKGIS